MGLSPSYLFWWQLMWWVTTDVAVSVCGRSGLWPFRFVAVPGCGRFGLWPFRFVAFSVCGHSGFWPFRSVAVPVRGRFGLWPFRLWPFRFVAVMTCYRRHSAIMCWVDKRLVISLTIACNPPVCHIIADAHSPMRLVCTLEWSHSDHCSVCLITSKND